ncbi:DMT family transporter [Pararhodobacter sp.]|uniref:DMT family transporter n=1 Tax=Pararhodobacter sp. TaxID=2127056 RepID=UPI002AFE26D7|nr:DMT family transporter [Pararhodobacter sp.]
MRLLLATVLVMVAFAANSLLNRAAVGTGEIGAMPFALIRVCAGAVVLAVLAQARPTWANLGPALALSLYLVGFSLAYLAIDAGIGALILFAGVQLTMLTGAVIGAERPPLRRFAGAAVALVGLGVLLWPGSEGAPALLPALLMGGAALGWGLYSLAGRKATHPVCATAANFLLAVPIVGAATLPFGWGAPSTTGLALAVASGALTSGLGYAVWYAVLPQLGAARAAVVQLTVPVIAIVAGVILLGETLSTTAALACAVVLAGVAMAVFPARR